MVCATVWDGSVDDKWKNGSKIRSNGNVVLEESVENTLDSSYYQQPSSRKNGNHTRINDTHKEKADEVSWTRHEKRED